jgi:hypothetical protein
MEYFAGLDGSMEDTRVCVVDRDGVVVHQAKVSSMPAKVEGAFAKAPSCQRVMFETGRMAPMVYHGLTERRSATIWHIADCGVAWRRRLL